MSWTLNGLRIYIQDFTEETKQQIARLQPLDGGTILHYFGYEEPIVKITGKVVGQDNYEAVRDLTMSGSGLSFVTDLETITCGVNSVSGKRDSVIAQTLDTTQECTAPVFTVSLELYKEI